MLCLAGNFVTEDSIASIINLINSTPELNIYSTFKLYLALKGNLTKEGLVKVALYILGESGDLLISNTVQGFDNEVVSVTEEEFLKLLTDILNTESYSSSVKEYLMNTLVKLSNKLSYSNKDRIKAMIENETKSYFYEVQQRAVEYSIFNKIVNKDLQRDITDHTPLAKTSQAVVNKKYY